MKRGLLFIVIAVMCLSLCSCGKSEAATNADNMILEIGEVTLESGDKIADAEEAVGNLEESDYKQLEELPVLEEARATYDCMVELENATTTIGTVTLEKVSTIADIRIKYDQASDTVKAGITNYAVLEQAEQQLSDLIENAITMIGTVTVEKEPAIADVRTKYDLASNKVKDEITNYAVLEQAEQQLSDLKVQNVINLIDQIPPIDELTKDSITKIGDARLALEGLSVAERKNVSNKEVLFSKIGRYETTYGKICPYCYSSLLNSCQEHKEQNNPSFSHVDLDSLDIDRFYNSDIPTMGEENALQSALDYLSFMAFSRSGLMEQLEYEGYSNSEATYAVEHCGANWYEQAALSAQEYLNVMSFSRQGLIEQLEYEGFTYEQAVYGVEKNGY